MVKRKYKFKWSYVKNGKRHLTRKAKRTLSRKLKKYYELVEESNFRLFKYSVKLIYESGRGTNHDQITECTLYVIDDKEPSDKQIKNYVIDHLEKMADELDDDFILNIPYQKCVVGLIDSSPTEQQIKKRWFENVKYSHNLGDGERRPDKKTRQSIMRLK